MPLYRISQYERAIFSSRLDPELLQSILEKGELTHEIEMEFSPPSTGVIHRINPRA